MYGLVVDLIDSYEHRLSELDRLIGTAYDTAEYCDDAVSQLREVARVLRENLKDSLARSCSLRRRDFDVFMARVFERLETRQRELEQERARIRAGISSYIAAQRQATAALRQELSRSVHEGSGGRLDKLVVTIKSSYGTEAEPTLARLREFELRVETFRVEQRLLHTHLRHLLDRGSSISFVDIKRLKAEVLGESAGEETRLPSSPHPKKEAPWQLQRVLKALLMRSSPATKKDREI